MLTRRFSARGRLALWLLVALLLATAAACSGVPAPNQAVPTQPGGASVQDQLAQLAAGAQASASETATVSQPASPPAATKAKATATPTRTARATATPADHLLTIALAQLPREAQQTVRLIRQGGAFPYGQDGATFGNREGLLPKRTSGYYQEYTVITPGSRDRGARRIIAGQGGELYYTDDHYDSFRRVIQ